MLFLFYEEKQQVGGLEDKMINIKYEETLESNDLKCPYCGEFMDDSWEIVKSDDRVEVECECGKKFWASEIVIRDFKGEADCELNGEQHQFEEATKDCMKCKVCGEFRLKETEEVQEE